MKQTVCICCERPGDPASAFPSMCVRCYGRLPQITRTLYASGGLPRPRVVEIARERTASVKAIGGGRVR